MGFDERSDLATTFNSDGVRFGCMAGFVTLLGGLSVLLTGVATYRFTSYFYRNDPLFVGTMAFTLTLVYVIAFEYILLSMGLLALGVPMVYIARKSNLISGSTIDGLPDSPLPSSSANTAISQSDQGVLDPYEDRRCPQCDEFFEDGDKYCGYCGTALTEGNR